VVKVTVLSAHDVLSALFHPDEVVVYQAHVPGVHGARVVAALKRHGYSGRVWTPEALLPDEARPSTAVVTVPLEALHGTLEDAARHGARVAVIGSSGFIEAEPDSRAGLEALAARAARRAVVRPRAVLRHGRRAGPGGALPGARSSQAASQSPRYVAALSFRSLFSPASLLTRQIFWSR